MQAPVRTAARRLPEIVRELDAAGLLLDDLSIRHPSLDDVFMTLIGHASDDCWSIGLIAIFAPTAVVLYRRKVLR